MTALLMWSSWYAYSSTSARSKFLSNFFIWLTEWLSNYYINWAVNIVIRIMSTIGWIHLLQLHNKFDKIISMFNILEPIHWNCGKIIESTGKIIQLLRHYDVKSQNIDVKVQYGKALEDNPKHFGTKMNLSPINKLEIG